MHSAGRRHGLAFVLATQAGMAVRPVGGRTHGEKRDLPDLHAGVEANGQIGDIGQFQRNVAGKAGVNKSSGGMDNQPQTTQAGLAAKLGSNVVAQTYLLRSAAQNKLAGVDDERLIVRHPHHFGQVRLGRFGVNARMLVVAENEKPPVQANINGGRLHQRLIVRRDDDAPTGDAFFNASVREYHRDCSEVGERVRLFFSQKKRGPDMAATVSKPMARAQAAAASFSRPTRSQTSG